MITYEYTCDSCDANFDVKQSIHDDAFTVCPECDTESLHRVFHAPHFHIKGEATTIGQLAERNAKRMSADEMAEKQSRFKKRETEKIISRTPQDALPASVPQQLKKDTLPWLDKTRTKTHKQVGSMTPEQSKKYVQTGE